MRKYLLILLLPFLVIFASDTPNVKNPYGHLLREFEKTFSFLKKETENGTVIYKGVELKGKYALLKISGVVFYTNTPLLVGEARSLTYTDFRLKGNCTVERVKFVLDNDKLFSIAENATINDKEFQLYLPQIVSTLLWNKNRMFYLSTASVIYKKNKQRFKDTVYTEFEAELKPDNGFFELSFQMKDKTFWDFSTRLTVENIAPDLLQILYKLSTEEDKLKIDNRIKEKLLSIIPREVEIRINVKPAARKLIREDIGKQIGDLQGELQMVKRGSLEETVLRAVLNVLKGKSDTIIVKVKNKAELNLGQIAGLITMLSMAKSDEQVLKLINPYFDIKVLDY